ncbi:hypothetical protein ABEB36_011230 [Hypothenemus hampei]|uniref:Uncharacterized protein n=1 Tax=Hypothenemus hampei TaxID=57062 RepID=A0ABD1EEM9_HYPHA
MLASLVVKTIEIKNVLGPSKSESFKSISGVRSDMEAEQFEAARKLNCWTTHEKTKSLQMVKITAVCQR